MKKYIVTLTEIWNGTMCVEAENENEAVEYAQTHLDEASFQHGETTADYAEEVEDFS